MTAGVSLNGQINVFKSLSPVLSQVVSHRPGGVYMSMSAALDVGRPVLGI